MEMPPIDVNVDVELSAAAAAAVAGNRRDRNPPGEQYGGKHKY